MTVQGEGADDDRAAVHTAWTSGASNRLLVAFSLVLTAALVVVEWAALGPTALALLVLPLVVLAVSRVRVIAGAHGLRIGLGPWGWPSRTVPADEIARAHPETLSAASMGGWGVRKKGTRTAYLVRGGECLVVTTVDERQIVVSCEDAARGAEVLNGRR